MRLILVLALAISTTGCAIKRPVRALYCDVRNPDGSCHTWAQHRELPPEQPMGGRGAVADE